MYWFVQKGCCCICVDISSSSASWTTTSSYQRICSIGNFPFYNVGNCQLRCVRIYHMYPVFQWSLSLIALDAMSSLCPHGRNVKLLSCSHVVMGNMMSRRNSMERNVPNLCVQIPEGISSKHMLPRQFFLFFLRLVSYSTKPFLVLPTPELYSRLRRQADQGEWPHFIEEDVEPQNA